MRLFVLALASALVGCAPPSPRITVTDGWARATAPGQSSGAFYATIVNDGGADRLTGVSSPAGMAMLHGNDGADGVARMRMLPELAIPAHGRVALAPGGTHVMVSGFAVPLTAGSSVELTLRFATAGPRTVSVAIVAPAAR